MLKHFTGFLNFNKLWSSSLQPPISLASSHQQNPCPGTVGIQNSSKYVCPVSSFTYIHLHSHLEHLQGLCRPPNRKSHLTKSAGSVFWASQNDCYLPTIHLTYVKHQNLFTKIIFSLVRKIVFTKENGMWLGKIVLWKERNRAGKKAATKQRLGHHRNTRHKNQKSPLE